MRKKRSILIIALLFAIISNSFTTNRTDSVYLFAYATTKNHNYNGLHFAWSTDAKTWSPIGPEHSYIKSDYDTWGAQKKMFTPFLIQDNNKLWHLLWSLNNDDDVFAHAAVDDLILWRRQSYPKATEGKNCLMPEVSYDKSTNSYKIVWFSTTGGDTTYYSNSTKDFKNYSPTKQVDKSEYKNLRRSFDISGNMEIGTLHKVSKKEVDKLIAENIKVVEREKLWAETTSEDNVRFKNLKPLNISITANGNNSMQISEQLIGIFFEDINYAADGGIYAELIENRGFEYDESDKKGRDKSWNSFKAWSTKGDINHKIEASDPLHENNPHYVILKTDQTNGSLLNSGFNGIPVKKGDNYNFSLFANLKSTKKIKLEVRLVNNSGDILSKTTVKNIKSGWKQYKATLKSNQTEDNAQLEIVIPKSTEVALDMISLFPEKTFKRRKNGLRADLAKLLEDVNPKFIRFPGGCLAHGDGIGNIYHWKNTIGPLEARKPQRNIWGYNQSAGLGYFEYFQFCEDVGAQPIPIVAAGVPCQNSSCGGAGQQGGIPMDEMDAYVQDVLDLVEWANGSTDTYWGKQRALAGHPEPFNLKYIGVGNEDLITDIFEERFMMIYNALKEKHPEIIVIGTVGPWFEGTDYREGWALAKRENIPMVDEHYYRPPGWFIYNQDYYDSYDRTKSKVYLGEYAAHLPNRHNNIETALAEALYLTAVERNGDIVEMTSYAPLLAKEGFTQWNPDLIYFNNTEVKPTPGYEVQKMYGNNVGDNYIFSKTNFNKEYDASVTNRFGSSVVRDTKNNVVYIKLVNMLPVETTVNYDLKNINLSSNEATLLQLTGEPSDRKVEPIESKINIAKKFEITIPKYSFTIIKINTK